MSQGSQRTDNMIFRFPEVEDADFKRGNKILPINDPYTIHPDVVKGHW